MILVWTIKCVFVCVSKIGRRKSTFSLHELVLWICSLPVEHEFINVSHFLLFNLEKKKSGGESDVYYSCLFHQIFCWCEIYKCKYFSFEERLVAQRREKEMATTELGFKKPLTKEEKIEKKKQRLAAIGNTFVLHSWLDLSFMCCVN